MSELEYEGMPVDVVRVSLTVTFDAYAVRRDDSAVTRERILYAVKDAVEYRAAMGEDTCDEDGIIAVLGDAQVTGRFEVLEGHPATSEDVARAAEGTSAER